MPNEVENIGIIMNAFKQGAILLDKDYNILFMNEYSLQSFEYNQQEILGKSVNILVPTDYQKHHNDLIHDPKFASQRAHIIKGMTKNGDFIQITLRLSPFIYENKIMSLVLFDLVTDNQTLEEVVNAGTWEWDIRTNEITWSKQLYKMFGIPEGPMSFEKSLEMLYKDDQARVMKLAQELLKSKKPYTIIYRAYNTQKETLYIYANSKAIIENDQVIKLTGSMQDITHYKNLETKLRITEKNLNNLGHEIKTSLSSLMVICTLLEETLSDSSSLDYLHVIYETVNYILQLSNNVLSFTKAQKNIIKINTENFNLPNLIKNVIKPYSLYTQRTEVDLQYYIQPDVPQIISSDSSLLFQVLNNLLSNSLKFTDKGIVRLVVSIENNQLFFRITDTGCGIAENMKSFIFVENSPLSTSGSGLGLYICKGIITALKGTIGFTSTLNTGSTFWFKIPISIVV